MKRVCGLLLILCLFISGLSFTATAAENSENSFKYTFEDGDAQGWRAVESGNVSVENGKLKLSAGTIFTSESSPVFQDGIVAWEYTPGANQRASFLIRYDQESGKYVEIGADVGSYWFINTKPYGGLQQQLDAKKCPEIKEGETYKVKVKVEGVKYDIWINGENVFSQSFPDSVAGEGVIGARKWDGGDMYYDNIRVNYGSVSGVIENKEGIKIPGVQMQLLKEGNVIEETVTNTFGEYEFDTLEFGKTYVVTGAFSSHNLQEQEVTVNFAEDMADIDFTFDVEMADKTKLNELLECANEIAEEDCLDGWDELQKAIREAEKVAENPLATQDMIDAAEKSLKDAVDALKIKDNLEKNADLFLDNAVGNDLRYLTDDNLVDPYFKLKSDNTGGVEKVETYPEDAQPQITYDLPIDAKFGGLKWWAHQTWSGGSVLSFRVNYYDLNSESFKPATHDKGKTLFEPELMKETIFQFDETYTTNSIQIILVESKSSWGDSAIIGGIELKGEWLGNPPPVTEPSDKSNEENTLKTNLDGTGIEQLTDGDKETSSVWQVKNNRYMQFYSDDLKELEKIVLYSDSEQDAVKEIQVQTNTTANYNWVTIHTIIPEWVEENNLYKCEIVPDKEYVGRNFKLVFRGRGEINLTEVEWVGNTYRKAENLLRKAVFSVGEEVVDGEELIDLYDGYTPSRTKVSGWTEENKVTVSFERCQSVKLDSVKYVTFDDLGAALVENGKFERLGEYEFTLEKPKDASETEVEISEIILSGTYIEKQEEATKTSIEKNEDGTITTRYAADDTGFIRNPSMGWVLYIEDFVANPHTDPIEIAQGRTVEEYWEEIDQKIANGLTPSILHIRLGWSWFEPEEGEYAWEDPDSVVGKLVKGAEERGLQLSFRVLLDSEHNSQNAVPDWVYDYGVTTGANRTLKINGVAESTPTGKNAHVNHPILLEKFENFMKVFSARFDNENTAYIDAQGVGRWGELGNICYDPQYGTEIQALKNIMDLYVKYFDEVLLGAQSGNKGFDYAMSQNFVSRRDGIGSPVWFHDGYKKEVKEQFQQGFPLYAENCFVGVNHYDGDTGPTWSADNSVTGWSLERVYSHVLSDALECRANTLDLRVLSDVEVWEKDYPDGLKIFNENGGYRLLPSYLTSPTEAMQGDEIPLDYAWKNIAGGRMPTKSRNWEGKYKVAFALLDRGGQPVSVKIEDSVDPGDWIRENGDNAYKTTFLIPEELESGNYFIATAIVNTRNGNVPQINLALEDVEQTTEGWYQLAEIKIGEEIEPEKPDKSGLEALIKEIEGIDRNAYTSESLAKLDQALEEAYAVMENAEADSTAVEAAVESLTDAKNGLEKIPVDPGEPEEPENPEKPEENPGEEDENKDPEVPGDSDNGGTAKPGAGNGADNQAVETGDYTLVLPIFMGTLASAAIICVIYVRRRTSK